MSGIDLQQAIFDKLTAEPSITNDIYDFVPSGVDGTYIVIGDIPIDDWSDKLVNGFEANPVIHVFGDVNCGRKEILDTQKIIFNTLHRQPLTIADHQWVDTNQSFSEVLREPDGVSYHGVQRMNILYRSTT